AIACQDAAAARKHLGTLTDNACARKRACALLLTLPDLDSELARTYRQRVAQLPDGFPWPDPFMREMNRHVASSTGRLEQFTALQRMGRLPEAMAHLRTMLAQSFDADAAFQLGLMLFQANDLTEAEEVFRTMIAHDPTNVKAHTYVGVI